MGNIRSVIIAFALVFAISSMYLLIGMQNAKAQEETAYSGLLKRIEALEAKPTGNVMAPKIRGLKIGWEMRHRFEQRVQAPNSSGLTAPVFQTGSGLIQRSNNILPFTRGGVGRAQDTDFTLQRLRLYFDADLNKNVRGFIKLQDTRTFGTEQSTVANAERTDLLVGYIELRNMGDLAPFLKNVELRVGRWQQWYGNHRLMGHLGWANEGRSYDGARLRWDNKKNAWIDVFAFSIQETSTGAASGDVPAPSETGDIDEVFFGVYSQFKPLKGVLFEPYTFIRSRSHDANDTGALARAGERRYTPGFRLHGKGMEGLGGLDFTIETAYQFGQVIGNMGPSSTGTSKAFGASAAEVSAARRNSEPIQAWALHAEVGYTFKDIAWTPRIGYAYVFASGDDRPLSGAAKTFDHLYPTGHPHNGVIDFAAWQNIENHQIHFNVKPTKKLVLDAKAFFFKLDEEADNWYGVAGGTSTIRRGADTFVDWQTGAVRNVDDELGQEIDLTVKYKLFKNFGVVAGYSHFWAGDFVEDTGFGNDRGVDWVWLMTTLKF